MTADLVPDSVVFRPRRLIILSTVACASLCGLSVFGWYALPPELRAAFLPSQIATLVIILLALVGAVVVIASSNVRADARGLRIRNGLGRHRLGWDSVHKFLLRPGDPWGLVLIKPEDRPFEVGLDAEKWQLMGIQAGDGEAAQRAIRTLTAMQRRYGTTRAMPGRTE